MFFKKVNYYSVSAPSVEKIIKMHLYHAGQLVDIRLRSIWKNYHLQDSVTLQYITKKSKVCNNNVMQPTTFYSVSCLFDKMDLLANLPPLAAVLVNVMLGRKHKYLITN